MPLKHIWMQTIVNTFFEIKVIINKTFSNLIAVNLLLMFLKEKVNFVYEWSQLKNNYFWVNKITSSISY